MMLPPKVRRSTMAAQSLGSVKVLVQPTEVLVGSYGHAVLFLALGQDLEQQLGAAPVQFHVAQFVDLCRYPHRWTYADIATMPRVSVIGSHLRDGGGVPRRLTGAGVGIVAG
jgi:hypothetical protein